MTPRHGGPRFSGREWPLTGLRNSGQQCSTKSEADYHPSTFTAGVVSCSSSLGCQGSFGNNCTSARRIFLCCTMRPMTDGATDDLQSGLLVGRLVACKTDGLQKPVPDLIQRGKACR